jgi:hypothetical protein
MVMPHAYPLVAVAIAAVVGSTTSGRVALLGGSRASTGRVATLRSGSCAVVLQMLQLTSACVFYIILVRYWRLKRSKRNAATRVVTYKVSSFIQSVLNVGF